jgi:hypothetical protein
MTTMLERSKPWAQHEQLRRGPTTLLGRYALALAMVGVATERGRGTRVTIDLPHAELRPAPSHEASVLH